MIETNFKGPRTTTATLRRRKHDRLKHTEDKNKEFVRERDRVCRFPLCPCFEFGLFLEVSHAEHKGMGGDPTGERSSPAGMLLVCNYRHKEAKYSLDKKTLRWLPLTDQGANGPIAWEIDLAVFSNGVLAGWLELAHEITPGRHSITDRGRDVLEFLNLALKDRFR